MGLLPEGASLYDPANIALIHHLMVALRAHTLYHRDQHYVVQDGEIIIVDEFTGRLMSGRRWSDGLHQGVEAKEGVTIQAENQTLASITFQNYFRMYEKLAGMTGTADTEAYEFQEIYKLETVVVPTHRDDDPQGPAGPGLPHRAREVQRHHHGHPRLLRARAAGAGRHHLDRELRAAFGTAGRAEAAAQRAQREAARARGGDRRAGGQAEADHHRHQHGRPRHRHRARRQHREADRGGRRPRRPDRRAEGGDGRDAARRMGRPAPGGAGCRRPAHRRHRAPRVAPHRQPAARPLRPPGRRRVPRASTCRWKIRC